MNKQEIDYINKSHEKFTQFIQVHQILDDEIRKLELRQLYNQPIQLDSEDQKKEIKKMMDQFEKEKQDLEKQIKELNHKKSGLVPIYETIHDQKFPCDVFGIIEISDDEQY
ncbi:unnamed protein product [Paramecium sonneborni]|uniref:Uncharacterized protein n=1 Tax=Paramecium sonneborni TaxID=65129 RepID=A0A8S1KF93_9CILI|nr:unnamed protein product [Paramecium sonneborni]